MKWTFNLKADGANLTGSTIGPMGRENQISEGKIDGDKVSFVVKVQGMQGNEMKITYKGTISGDELTLTMEREGGMGAAPVAELVAAVCRCLPWLQNVRNSYLNTWKRQGMPGSWLSGWPCLFCNIIKLLSQV
jgi:hypothetical protein